LSLALRSLGRERVLDQMLARLLRIAVDQRHRLGPGGGEALGDVRPCLDEVARQRAAGDEGIGIGIAQDVMRDHARLDGARDAELAHGGRVWLERVARIESAGLHHVDVLRHIELVDGVIALLEARRSQGRLRHRHIGRPGRRHDLRALEILERGRRMVLADHELLHLVGLVLAVERDVHRHARFLEVGVHSLDGHQHGRGVDLVGDHGCHVRRSADQPHHLRLDVLLLEEAALRRHEVRQRRAHGKHADLDLVLRRGGHRRQHQRAGNGRQ
jgi:hypothetical protein